MYSDEVAVLPNSPPPRLLNDPSWRTGATSNDDPGLPPNPYRPGFERWDGSRQQPEPQSRFVSQPTRTRHVTFSTQEPHLDKATGNIHNVNVPPAAANRPRLLRSASHMPAASYEKQPPPAESEEDEHFVDGSYFFNHLVRNKEAEDYNMAEMLRERSRELQRRRLFGRDGTSRRPWRNAEIDRLSTSLPSDYFVGKPTGYYCYRGERPRDPPPPRPKPKPQPQPPQDTPFADGLEIEIPPRRHGGLGGGGLRQSLSADRLLMVPPSHRDSSRFGRHYFHSGLSGEHPTSYSSANLVPRPTTPQSIADQHRAQPAPNSGPVAARYSKPGPELITNRYNVRKGRFEPEVDTPPELPPKAPPPPKIGPILYESDSWDRRRNAELQPKPKMGHVPYESESWDNRRNAELSANRSLQGRPPINHGSRLEHRIQDANSTWSAKFEGGQHPDPRLSVSFDPSRFRGHEYQVQNAANALREAPRQTGYEPQPQRKGVTWRDQEQRWRPDSNALNLSRTHPGTSFQENLGFEDQESSKDDTRSTFREGFSYPSNDSLLRSLAVNDLKNVDQFALFEVSTSKLNWAESFMGTNLLDKMTQYKFVVLNRHEEVLFFGAEDDCSISNCILSPQKSSFKVRILDANGHDFVHFRRLYPVKPKTNLTIGNKKKYRLEVSTPSGHVIGNVEKTYNSDTYYILEDRAGACLFLVQRSCICTCPLFWDYEFKILMPEGDTEVGEISWSYLTAQDEQFNGTEISFPIDLNTTSKIMLLGVCFLLNFSRWQSAYLDSMHNPRARKSKARQRPSDESREVAALLETSPEDHGFHGREDPTSGRGAHGREADGNPS